MTFFIGHAFGLLRAESSFFPFGSQLCTSSPVFFHRYFLRFSANRRSFSSVMPLVSCEPKALSSPLAHSYASATRSGALAAGLFSLFFFQLSAFPYPSPTFSRKCDGYKTKKPSPPWGRKAALQTADYLEGFGPSAMPKAARKGSIPFLSPCGCPFLTWSRGRAGRPPAPHIPFCRRRGSG